MQGILVESVQKTFRGRRIKVLGLSLALLREKPIKALDGISLSVSAGESVGIIGPNGAGKTTLMGCLLGFIYPDSGRVLVDGCDPNTMHVRSLIGYVPERLNFHTYLTMEELLTFHYDLARLPPGKRKEKIAEVLTLVQLDQTKWRLPVSKCSRGMLQRLAIAQALIADPKYLFLDEPTSGVDPGGVLEITSVLSRVKQQGMTVVLNSHQLDQVERICDRMVFVSHGRATDAEELQSAGNRHSLVLRFAVDLDDSAKEKLAEIAEQLEVPLISVSKEIAEFSVLSDDDNLRLLKCIVQSDLPLVEAAPEYNKLERMFLQSKDLTQGAQVP